MLKIERRKKSYQNSLALCLYLFPQIFQKSLSWARREVILVAFLFIFITFLLPLLICSMIRISDRNQTCLILSQFACVTTIGRRSFPPLFWRHAGVTLHRCASFWVALYCVVSFLFVFVECLTPSSFGLLFLRHCVSLNLIPVRGCSRLERLHLVEKPFIWFISFWEHYVSILRSRKKSINSQIFQKHFRWGE